MSLGDLLSIPLWFGATVSPPMSGIRVQGIFGPSTVEVVKPVTVSSSIYEGVQVMY